MDLLRVAGATLNQTALDFTGNRDRIIAIMTEARSLGVELLVLPELALSGYGCEDAFFSLNTAKVSETMLGELLPHTRGLAVVLGLPHFYYGAMYNCAAMIQDGRILGMNAKRVLPREGVHYEPRWFRPWPFGKVAQTRLCGAKVPLGDIRYRFGAVGVAVEICEEAWASVPASAAHADAVDLILNPSASHFALGKYEKREHLVANSSRSMQVIYVYTNLLGVEAGRTIYDGGVLFAEGGEIVERGRRFGFSDGEITWRDVNPELASLSKLKVKPVRDGESDPVGAQFSAGLATVEITGGEFSGLKSSNHALPRMPAVATAPPRLTRNDEFLFAEILGLFDYLRKAAARGYVVPLSGGCDSSACAVLIAQMVTVALAELGPERFAHRLKFALPMTSDPKVMIRALLTCMYLSTKNSGAVTRAAATALATELGAAFHIADVDAMVVGYTKSAETMLGRELNWRDDDATLQNIQARSRAPLAWMIANAEGKILLTTSNRSEAAVGYATMDGDTAGGLAPLAGIDKLFLRQWLVWAERECVHGLGQVKSLALVNAQAPTAELRPANVDGGGQTDEDDLMPYAVLERIERYMVRDRLGPGDILQMLGRDFPTTAGEVLRGYVTKFLRLWAQSQWKRERFAPSFHLDDESVDPKTWCRFPILSQAYVLAPLITSTASGVDGKP